MPSRKRAYRRSKRGQDGCHAQLVGHVLQHVERLGRVTRRRRRLQRGRRGAALRADAETRSVVEGERGPPPTGGGTRGCAAPRRP
eukprot:11646028-Heterocapsa_arctica.AAC.1